MRLGGVGTEVNDHIGFFQHAAHIIALLGRLAEAGLDFIKTEHLYTFDGKPGFSLGQGE